MESSYQSSDLNVLNIDTLPLNPAFPAYKVIMRPEGSGLKIFYGFADYKTVILYITRRSHTFRPSLFVALYDNNIINGKNNNNNKNNNNSSSSK